MIFILSLTSSRASATAVARQRLPCMSTIRRVAGIHSVVTSKIAASSSDVSTSMMKCKLPKMLRAYVRDKDQFQVVLSRQFSTSSSSSSSTTIHLSRPFRILGIQQIAVGGLEKGPMTSFWVDILGLSFVSSFRSTTENVDEDVLCLGQAPYAVEVDLMTPLDPNQSPKVLT
jgi:hypothetical protein